MEVPRDPLEKDMILWVQKLWLVEDTALSWLPSQAKFCLGQDLQASAPSLKACLLTGAWHGRLSSMCRLDTGGHVVCVSKLRLKCNNHPLTNQLVHLRLAIGFAWVPRKVPTASLNNNDDCQAPFWYFHFPKHLPLPDLIISLLQPFEAANSVYSKSSLNVVNSFLQTVTSSKMT